MTGYSPVEGGGAQRTDMYCHSCSRNFVAELDFDINGKHEIECPYCAHIHYRTITDGKITESRWRNDGGTSDPIAKARSVWKSNVIKAQTSTVSQFIRDKWLNRSDV